MRFRLPRSVSPTRLLRTMRRRSPEIQNGLWRSRSARNASDGRRVGSMVQNPAMTMSRMLLALNLLATIASCSSSPRHDIFYSISIKYQRHSSVSEFEQLRRTGTTLTHVRNGRLLVMPGRARLDFFEAGASVGTGTPEPTALVAVVGPEGLYVVDLQSRTIMYRKQPWPLILAFLDEKHTGAIVTKDMERTAIAIGQRVVIEVSTRDQEIKTVTIGDNVLRFRGIVDGQPGLVTEDLFVRPDAAGWGLTEKAFTDDFFTVTE